MATKIGKLEKSAGSIQRRLHKGLEESLPIGVQKSYFMLSDDERDILNTALDKYQPGQPKPILVAGKNLLKPALRLMTWYRLVIEEIKDAEVIKSYTRWVDAVQVKGAEDQEVFLTFSPRFEHIWLESKKRLMDMFPRSPPISDSEVNTLFACTVGRKSTSRSEQSAFPCHWRNFEKSSGWSR